MLKSIVTYEIEPRLRFYKDKSTWGPVPTNTPSNIGTYCNSFHDASSPSSLLIHGSNLAQPYVSKIWEPSV